MKYKPGTFVQVPNIQHLANKKSSLQSLFMWLMVYSNEEGICYPKRQTLAKKSGADIKTVDKYLRELELDGFITIVPGKRKAGDVRQQSNTYQINIIETDIPKTDDLPKTVSVIGKNGTTLDTENGAVTIPSINNTHLTISSDVPSEPDLSLVKPIQEVNPLVMLPDRFGKTPNERLGYVYKALWRVKFGDEPKMFNYARFGKAMKDLKDNLTEIQIAAVMDTYFDWMGVNGNNQSDNDFLVGNGFTVELMVKRVDIYLAYIKNVLGASYDDIEGIRTHVRKVFKLKNIV